MQVRSNVRAFRAIDRQATSTAPPPASSEMWTYIGIEESWTDNVLNNIDF